VNDEEINQGRRARCRRAKEIEVRRDGFWGFTIKGYDYGNAVFVFGALESSGQGVNLQLYCWTGCLVVERQQSKEQE
jgi:hypothetical protein